MDRGEFARIRSIHFEGNDKVKTNDLREAFPVHVGQFANPAAINCSTAWIARTMPTNAPVMRMTGTLRVPIWKH